MARNEKPKLPYIAPFEIIVHNKPNDCWISFLRKVLNITPLIQKHKKDPCIKPLLAFAGKDVSHWFDEKTGEIQHFIHPVSNVKVPFCPHGRLPDVEVEVPSVLWKPLEDVPWWKNEKYQIGILTKKVRPIRIINTLIGKQVTLNVCWEDTFMRILERYSTYNKNPTSYTWRYLCHNVEMDKTMEENGIPDDRDRFTDLGIPHSYYIPCVLLYYNDDFSYYDDINFKWSNVLP